MKVDPNTKFFELAPPDDGHVKLMNDLDALVLDAAKGEFHDFANQKYAMPKVELSNRLHQIRMNVVEGKYDNEPKPNGDSTGGTRNS